MRALHFYPDCAARNFDESIKRFGLRVLKSPAQSPKANAECERLVGTIRRECLDWVIPMSEAHLSRILSS
jgi:putative transposase